MYCLIQWFFFVFEAFGVGEGVPLFGVGEIKRVFGEVEFCHAINL